MCARVGNDSRVLLEVFFLDLNIQNEFLETTMSGIVLRGCGIYFISLGGDDPPTRAIQKKEGEKL